MLASGDVDPAKLDPEAFPDWVFVEAQLARTRTLMGEMSIPTELRSFFEATLGGVGEGERKRAARRDRDLAEGASAELSGRRLKDLGFGELEWHEGRWTGQARLAGFYGKVTLEIEAPTASPPSGAQRAAYDALEVLDARFRAELGALLVGFYAGLRVARPEKFSPLKDPEDVWQVLDGPVLTLPLDGACVWLDFRRAGGGSKRVRVELRGGRLWGVGLV